jgi:RNA polymerase sigma-70 factor (ECF subfamily)
VRTYTFSGEELIDAKRGADIRSWHSNESTRARRERSPTVTITSDEMLVDRISMGDDRALSELYDRYSRPVYTMGVRLLGDTHLAEELVQDAFTSVWRRATTFDSNRASFATWLYRVARNRAVDLNRRRRARPISVGEEPLRGISSGPEPEAGIDGWDMARALSSIPDEHREVLTMAYFEGLSQREISQRITLPLGTVKSRTTAALKRLRRALENPVVEEAWHE